MEKNFLRYFNFFEEFFLKNELCCWINILRKWNFSAYQILIKMPKMSIWELIYDIYSAADKDETKTKQKLFISFDAFF